jgi:hypothetical protein
LFSTIVLVAELIERPPSVQSIEGNVRQRLQIPYTPHVYTIENRHNLPEIKLNQNTVEVGGIN